MSVPVDEQILGEVRITNKLLAQVLIMGKENQTEKIMTLVNCGLPQIYIAEILNVGSNYVSSIVSRAKKGRAPRREKVK